MLKSKVTKSAALRAPRRLPWLAWRDRSGNVAMIFGLAAIPFFTLGGMAVDYSRALMVKNRLSEALDATALAVGGQANLTTAQIQTQANAFFNANYSVGSVGAASALTVSANSTTVTISATASVNTLVLGLIGFNTIPVASSVEVTRDSRNLEIALVLDNTGSMADSNKIGTLISSADNFVDTMATAAANAPQPNAVKISVVPYTQTVNIGTAYKTASWMSGVMPTAYGADIFTTANTNRFALFTTMLTPWGGCVELRPQPYDVQDDVPGSGGTLYVPYFSPDEPDDTGQGYVNNYLADVATDKSKTWQIKQGNPLKYIVKPKTGTNGIGYQFGPNAGCISQTVVRLTTDFSAVKTGINAMVAGGDTVMHLGFAWGWNTLAPNGPFSDGVAYNDGKTTKVMIIMTDGENHNVVTSSPDASAYGGAGYIWQGRLGMTSGSASQRQAALDARLALACTNAKARGIVIYSIMFDLADDAQNAPAMMQACATSADTYYLVSNVADLDPAFQSIANSIQHLRITK